MEAGLTAAEAKICEARSGHLPKVGLFGSLTRIENSYDKGIVTPENRNS
jgi:outer membrane protein TolC